MKIKSVVAVLIILMMLFSFACAENETVDITKMSIEQLTELREKIDAEIKKRNSQKSTNTKWDFVNFGDASFKYEQALTYENNGKKYLIVEFVWKNNSKSADCFGTILSFEAYQDGIELNRGYIFGVETNSTTKIMPGKTLNGCVVFELRNNKSDVEFVAKNMFDFFGKYNDFNLTITL